ncbi:MAG: MFS transporter [Chloroflexi bacterium]|nr:MFS transporter [Chloroflexota bacterium]
MLILFSQESSHLLNQDRSSYKWVVLVMVGLLNLLVVAVAWQSMPVLFNSVARDLGLTLAQIGIIWSMMPIGAGVSSLFGGMLADRFGCRMAVSSSCFLMALVGALRGLSPNFAFLATTMFFLGLFSNIGYPGMLRALRLSFPAKQFSTANGITIAAFGTGATLVTALGGGILTSVFDTWRNVLYFYAAISLVLGIAWHIIIKESKIVACQNNGGAETITNPSFKQAFSRVISHRNVWLLAMAAMGQFGAFRGLSGYLPLYLEETGIKKVTADAMVSTVFLFSIFGALTIPFIADRLGKRKLLMLGGQIVFMVSAYLVSRLTGNALWGLLPLYGMVANGTYVLLLTMGMDAKGLGAVYAGTAAGLIITVGNIGGFLGPVVGGRLAETDLLLPFTFWASLVAFSVICIYFVDETK